ncbi:MAG: hypothetical protein SOZ80_05290 [Prevotella sp.]|uniref:hypothetical protein n=1 Tax=Prevotella sp. TaxID=59823 RepID=UPI002A27CA8D|nr:hypothetical protein [Prevotella sp.]MDD7318475.1 hypothetical protein [Prevotellaceae bacterium]MDY4020174.1 hypothetical protein [Prevotella sp.]
MDTRQIDNILKGQRLWVIAAVVATLVIAAISVISLSQCSSDTADDGESLSVAAALDSLEQRLPGGTGFLVKFADERRHCLFYLNGGHLYKFDGITKRLDEVLFTALTEGAAIYYNDSDINAGIREAVLSPDGEFIMLTAAVSPTGKDGKAMQGLYRMNTVNLTIDALAQGYVAREGDLFFVSVIDKNTGRQRAMLGFDRSGKQVSREKQQEMLKAYKPDVKPTADEEGAEGDGQALSGGSDNATPAVNSGSGVSSSADVTKDKAEETQAKPASAPATAKPVQASDKE